MNIEQAKAIPISQLLDKLNITPDRDCGRDLYYRAFWRGEKTASVHVNADTNEWYDHGAGEGGGIVNLAQKILEAQNEPFTRSDALRYISNLTGDRAFIAPVECQPHKPDRRLTIVNIQPVQHIALTQYLDSRCIYLKTAKKYLKQLRLYNKQSGNYFFALGFKNENGGYELRNARYQGTVTCKDITFIRGSEPDLKSLHLFEGWPDFVTLAQGQPNLILRSNSIVLNSLSNLKKATPLIQGHGYRVAYTWMDNDDAGAAATKSLADFFKTEKNLIHKPQGYLYQGYKDLNEWRVAQHKRNMA